MKVGDYVRTDKFGIQKVKWFDHEEPILENGFTALQKSGYKVSPNIIDLIEEGDYVNGGKVLDIDLDDEIMVIDNIEGFIHYSNGIFNIKSIVTKEQFEAMEYKVGE